MTKANCSAVGKRHSFKQKTLGQLDIPIENNECITISNFTQLNKSKFQIECRSKCESKQTKNHSKTSLCP